MVAACQFTYTCSKPSWICCTWSDWSWINSSLPVFWVNVARFFEKGFVQELCCIVCTTVLDSRPSWDYVRTCWLRIILRSCKCRPHQSVWGLQAAWVGTEGQSHAPIRTGNKPTWPLTPACIQYLPRPLRMANYWELWFTQCSITLEWSPFQKSGSI